MVAHLIVRRKAHVPLGVNGIVIPPVNHRSARDTETKDIGVLQQAQSRHVSAVGESKDANTTAVDVVSLPHRCGQRRLIGKINLAKLAINRILKGLGAASGSTAANF